MRKLNFALSVLVLPFAFYSVQAQAAEMKTGTLIWACAARRSISPTARRSKTWASKSTEAIERAKLRKEAESMKTEIELSLCQRITDQIVKHW